MNITIPMLLESINSSELTEVHMAKNDSISTIRIFSASESMEQGILYLTRDLGTGKVVCQTARGTSFCFGTDPGAALNRIMEVLEYYNAWHLRLTKAADSGCTLTELLNISNPVIHHPLAILDANEWEIAHSDLAGRMEFDRDWSDMVQNHTSDALKIAEYNSKFHKYFRLKKIYRIPGDIFANGYACNLFHEQVFCGVMLMAEPDSADSVTQGELDAMQSLCALICDMISLHSYDGNLRIPDKPLLEYLTQGNEEALQQLERSLRIAGWEKNDQKWMLYARPLDTSLLAPQPATSKLIFGRMEGVVTAEYESGLVILCNLRILKNKEQAECILSEYLRQISYYAGASSEFSNLELTRNMAEQAMISLRHGSQYSGDIHPFEEAAPAYLLAMLKELDNGALEHPCLEKLKDHDRRFGSKLYETFYAYLKNERRLSPTMAELHIPKSTLRNRLNRIEELLDIPLDKPEVRLYILLSYMLKSEESEGNTL